MSKIATPPDRRSTDFQTYLERRFTPGRFSGIDYTAGLEAYAASFSLALLSCVSLRSRHIATAETAARPSQGRRSRKVMIIVPLS